jgi:hypothetical protein
MQTVKTAGILLLLACYSQAVHCQSRYFSITGTAALSYEGYGLDRKPAAWPGIYPRRPYNQLRFNFHPVLSFGKDFSLPVNIDLQSAPTSFAGPYAGLKKPSFGQWLTNPANNIALNPKYKWAELQLGTQYLKYSDLSTGDIGIFGAGFDLRPKTFRIRFFSGVSQQGVNYAAGPPLLPGSYQRRHWMFSLGREQEGKYRIAINLAKGTDRINSVSVTPPGVLPQESFVASALSEVSFRKGFYFKSEFARSWYTRNVGQPVSPTAESFKPFLDGRISTGSDWAAQGSVGRKSRRFDISYGTRYIGAGFQTTGYPYLQPDRWENTLNTRISAWKDRMNITASAGTRVNNLSATTLRASQFIGNLNWFSQWNDRFSTNLNYSNFGFSAPSGTNPYGIRNVSNDAGLTGTYIWSNDRMSHLITGSYNFSLYDERDVITGLTTTNQTHSIMLSYVPTYFKSELSPEFNILYFYNQMPLLKNTLLTIGAGLGTPLFHKKAQLKSQLQYTLGKINAYSPNHNLVAALNFDYKLTKKLGWNVLLSGNYFKYGNELAPTWPGGPRYLETNYRTGFTYKF